MAAINTTKTNPLIWIVLLITVGMTIWMALQDVEADEVIAVNKFDRPKQNRPVMVKEKALSTGEHAVAPVNTGIIDWGKLERMAVEKPKDIFAQSSWVVAQRQKQQALAAPPPPPAPTAPPVPFSYMGRLNNSPQGNLIYLADSEKSYSVVLGKQVDGFWRLDKEDDAALYFTYLPLNLPQRLSKN